MTDPDINTAMILGEIRGQLRELIHGTNTNSAKLDALDRRVGKLESGEARREGATGALSAIMKSPTLGWLVGAAISAWAILTGKVHV